MRRVCGLGVVLACVGCRDPITPMQFEHGLVAAQCSFAARCGQIARSEESSCVSAGYHVTDRYVGTSGAPPLDEGFAAKRLMIDASAAGECFSSIADGACPGTLDALSQAACNDAIIPLVAPGGACDDDSECIKGVCSFPLQSGCGGTCTAFVPEGATCGNVSANACDPDIDFCRFTAMGATCIPLVHAGGRCAQQADCRFGLLCTNFVCAERGREGSTCDNSSCGPGLYCAMGGPGLPRCAPLLHVGEPCLDFNACAEGLRCVSFPAPNAPAICLDVLELGDPCDPALNVCPLDARCSDDSHVCEVPPGGVGSPCGVDEPCAAVGAIFTAPLYCDTSTGMCRELLIPGEPCTPPTDGSFDPCLYACDPTTALCTVPAASCP